jgi:hypothetical protein
VEKQLRTSILTCTYSLTFGQEDARAEDEVGRAGRQVLPPVARLRDRRGEGA